MHVETRKNAFAVVTESGLTLADYPTYAEARAYIRRNAEQSRLAREVRHSRRALPPTPLARMQGVTELEATDAEAAARREEMRRLGIVAGA